MLMLCRLIKLYLGCKTNKIRFKWTTNSSPHATKRAIYPPSTKLCWRVPNSTSSRSRNCQTIAKNATLTLSSWDRWLGAKETARESCGIETDANMRESGTTIWEMEEDSRGILITILISVSSKTEKRTEKVFIHGIMEKFMMESGIKDWSMAMASGEAYQETRTLVNGVILKPKDSESIPGKTVIVMRANGDNVWNMDRAQTSSKMVTRTQVSTRKANLMAKVNTLGKMDRSMWESLDKGSSMVRVDGRVLKDLSQAISTKVTILTTKSKDTVCLYGPAEILTKVSIKKMNVMAMEKWNGPMVAYIKASGLVEFSMVTVRWSSQTGSLRKEHSNIMFTKVQRMARVGPFNSLFNYKTKIKIKDLQEEVLEATTNPLRCKASISRATLISMLALIQTCMDNSWILLSRVTRTFRISTPDKSSFQTFQEEEDLQLRAIHL